MWVFVGECRCPREATSLEPESQALGGLMWVAGPTYSWQWNCLSSPSNHLPDKQSSVFGFMLITTLWSVKCDFTKSWDLKVSAYFLLFCMPWQARSDCDMLFSICTVVTAVRWGESVKREVSTVSLSLQCDYGLAPWLLRGLNPPPTEPQLSSPCSVSQPIPKCSVPWNVNQEKELDRGRWPPSTAVLLISVPGLSVYFTFQSKELFFDRGKNALSCNRGECSVSFLYLVNITLST